MTSENAYWVIGSWLGSIVGIITFIGSWIFCVAHYGYLVGVSLGWIPSAIVAVIAGLLVFVLWGLVAWAGAMWFLWTLVIHRPSRTPRPDPYAAIATPAPAPNQ